MAKKKGKRKAPRRDKKRPRPGGPGPRAPPQPQGPMPQGPMMPPMQQPRPFPGAMVPTPGADPEPFPSLTGAVTARQNKQDLAWIKDKIKELVDYLMAKYPNDRRSQTLKVNIKQVKLVPEYAMRQGILGGFTYETGILEMAMYDDGKKRDEGSLLTSLLHELAHCCDSFVKIAEDHGPQWRVHLEWLLQVATKELKWNVTMLCGDCPGYLLCKLSQCPLCKWECKPRANPPAKGDAEQAPGDDFTTYPRESYNRVCSQPYDWAWLQTMCRQYETRNNLPRKPPPPPAATPPPTTRPPAPSA